ncbi:hypothetical protein, partial [Arcticibacter eurypsychrophilus]|uniref:hypothetical protein n=1 Tax=Arcticibacter eurypsychrophilus TaxID=1434752 RepID=UPI001112D509
MTKSILDNNANILFNYSFSSGLGCYEHGRFVTDIVLEIVLTNDLDDKIETIGKIDFLIVHIDEASQGPYSLYEVLDAHSEYLARYAFEFFDWKSGDYTKKVENYYHGDLMSRNFCLIEKITILPKYRGYSIGAKAIRDLVFHYSAACGLFVIRMHTPRAIYD